jgi:hypothetical protein
LKACSKGKYFTFQAREGTLTHMTPHIAQQGHRYLLDGQPVISLEHSHRPKVLYVLPDPMLWITRQVDARQLTPQPLRYFHGEMPK